MRLVACTSVLNEEDYIWYVLKSVSTVVDLHIIVEGSCWFSDRYDLKTGCSVDRTSEIIHDFISSGSLGSSQIVYIKVGHLPKEKFVRQYYAKYLNEGDVYFSIDADCVWHPEDIQRVYTLFKENPEDIEGAFANRLTFWQDFRHLLVSGEDITSARFIPMVIWHGGYGFTNVGTLKDKNNDNVFHAFRIKNKIIDIDLDCYHYGWVRMKEKHLEKRMQTLKRFRDTADGSPKFAYLKNMNDDDLRGEAFFQGKMFTDEYDRDEKVVKFKGCHPKVMKCHPWYNKLRKDFDY